MAIQDDFTIHPDTKVIRHVEGNTTVFTTVSFYSFLQDAFDEPGFLSYEIPIRFNTPTSFTMLNGWLLDDGDTSNLLQYLTGGGIDTLGYSTIADPVTLIDLDYGMSSFVPSDLDKTVTIDGTNIGPLLSFKDDYPSTSTARIWVRDTNSFGATVPGQNVVVTLGGGDYTTSGYSQTGDNIYHNLFTIAAFTGNPDPQLYIYQNHPVDSARTRISEWSSFDNWDRGSIDILVTTQLGGTLIDGGNITTFARQTGDSFTFVESTLTTSGRTPVATETAADEVNIIEGEHYLLYDGSDTGSFTAGDVIQDVSTSDLSPPIWYAEVVNVTEFADTTTGRLELRGLRGTITDGDNIYVGTTLEATANGTPGDTYISYTGTDPTTLDEQTITGGVSTAVRLLTGFDATENKMVCRDDPTVTGTGRNVYYKDFDNAESLTGGTDGALGTTDAVSTTIISGFNDVTVAHINGTVTATTVGTLAQGERVTWAGGEAIFVIGAASPITLGNVQNPDTLNGQTVTGDDSSQTFDATSDLTDSNRQEFNFTLQNFTGGNDAIYSVFIEGGTIYEAGRSLTDIYAYLQYYLRDGQSISDRIIYTSDNSIITQVAAEEYIKADSSYTATKAAPYGTLAGGVFFGAQAVWVQGMRTEDNNNLSLTDAGGTLRQPFTSIDVTVSNTRADDRIAIYLEAGTTELPNKTQYTGSYAYNIDGGDNFVRDDNDGAFPNDTPVSGAFTVVDSELDRQHRYRYASFDALGGSFGTDGRLLLPSTITSGTSDGITTQQTLQDTGADFSTDGILVGDIIARTSGTLGYAYVTSVTNSTTVVTTLLEDTEGTANRTWVSGDTYTMNRLVKTYTNSDNFFIPYMDEISTDTTDVTVSLTFVAVREIILEVRNVEATTEIIPFKTTGQISATGYTQGVIRNEDTVFTP